MTPYSHLVIFIIALILSIGFQLIPTEGNSNLRKICLCFINILIACAVLGNQIVQIAIFCILNYVLAKTVIRCRKNHLLYFSSLILSLIPLCLSKAHVASVSFIGISYVTFRSLTVLFEARDGVIKNESFGIVRYFSYLIFFPTLASGPIQRYRQYCKDWDASPLIGNFKTGLSYILIGLVYKSISLVLSQNALPLKFTSVFVTKITYMYSYSAYLFFDFAGYSLLAIGCSVMLGFKCPENFMSPFRSINLKDFWNRWHISLSFWFRDFVFMRIASFILKKQPKTNKLLLVSSCTLITFLLMGVWHGFALHYIAYGLYHAFGLILLEVYMYFGFNKSFPIPKTFSWFITFNFICFGFYIFSGNLLT